MSLGKSALPPSAYFTHGGCEILRPATGDPTVSTWKRVSAYALAGGRAMYAVDSDMWGNDRYGNFTETFTDENGAISGTRELCPLVSGRFVPTLMELFVGLDPVGNTLWRGYTKGVFDTTRGDSDGHSEFSRHGTLVLEYSKNGGETFKQALNVSNFAHECNLKQRIIVSCGQMVPLAGGHLLFPFYLQDFDRTDSLTQLMVLHAIPDAAGDYTWKFSQPVAGKWDNRSFDLTESSIASLADGKLAIFSRAENNEKRGVPPYKWFAVSADGGFHWSEASPLRVAGQHEIFSPSSCGYAVNHSSGRLFYITNFFHDRTVCHGGGPRYKLDICEIDPSSMEILPESLFPIDGQQQDEIADLAISNFWVFEDRATGEIVVDTPRAYAHVMYPGDIDLRRIRIQVKVK